MEGVEEEEALKELVEAIVGFYLKTTRQFLGLVSLQDGEQLRRLCNPNLPYKKLERRPGSGEEVLTDPICRAIQSSSLRSCFLFYLFIFFFKDIQNINKKLK